MAQTQLQGASSQTTLLDLASNIMKQTEKLTAYLKANNLPEPSHEPGTTEFPEGPEYNSIMASLEELQHLVDGPRRSVRYFACENTDLAAYHVALEFEFFQIVPLKGEIHIQELAKTAGLDVDRASRVLRMLATHRIFQEKRPGYFSHTASSALFLEDEGIRSAGFFVLDELWKGATAAAAAFKDSPYESSNTQSPFNKAFGVPMFTFLAEHPENATRFAKAMAGITTMDRPILELEEGFDWGKLQGKKVVDVGGGSGHVSMALARRFPNLEFVVEDESAHMLGEGEKLLTPDIKGRISFLQYNFFQQQPLRDVGTFFIRQCTHNWCDRDVVKIFKGFVPGLEGSDPNTPLLINDTILPEPGVRPPHEERRLRQMDILMLIALGAKQRTKAEFAALLKEADPRYEIHSVHADGSMGLLEVRLKRNV